MAIKILLAEDDKHILLCPFHFFMIRKSHATYSIFRNIPALRGVMVYNEETSGM